MNNLNTTIKQLSIKKTTSVTLKNEEGKILHSGPVETISAHHLNMECRSITKDKDLKTFLFTVK